MKRCRRSKSPNPALSESAARTDAAAGTTEEPKKKRGFWGRIFGRSGDDKGKNDDKKEAKKGNDSEYRVASRPYPRVASLKTPAAFRDHLSSSNIPIHFDDTVDPSGAALRSPSKSMAFAWATGSAFFRWKDGWHALG